MIGILQDRRGHDIKGFFMFKKFLSNDDGATAIEYGLIAAGISIAIAGVVYALGEDLAVFFDNILRAI